MSVVFIFKHRYILPFALKGKGVNIRRDRKNERDRKRERAKARIFSLVWRA